MTASHSQAGLGWTLAQFEQQYGKPVLDQEQIAGRIGYVFKGGDYVIAAFFRNAQVSRILYICRVGSVFDWGRARALLVANASDAIWDDAFKNESDHFYRLNGTKDGVESYYASLSDDRQMLAIWTKEDDEAGRTKPSLDTPSVAGVVGSNEKSTGELPAEDGPSIDRSIPDLALEEIGGPADRSTSVNIETSPESADSKVNDRKLSVTSPEKRRAMSYSSDPYELLPRWLIESSFQISQKSAAKGPMKISERGWETFRSRREKEDIATTPLDAPIVGSSSTPVAVAVKATTTPGKDATLVVDALGPLEHEKSEDKFTLPASELAQSSPQRLTTVEPVSRNMPKPTLANQNKSFAQLSQNAGKGSEPKPARALTGFVEMQGNNLLTNASPEERREPQGYITVESKPEPLRSGVGRNRSPKPSEARPKIQEASTEPADNPPKSQDGSSKHRDSSAPGKTVGESADLQRFASDFVRTNRSGSITDQHRFYADSVHFYGEGDLSWAGVAAATRRYHQERQNRRYAAAAAAVVKGPVDGGFYVLDQPVSWVQMNGSRGRSMLRLRVIPTVRSGWKITSIEEVGP